MRGNVSYFQCAKTLRYRIHTALLPVVLRGSHRRNWPQAPFHPWDTGHLMASVRLISEGERSR